MKYGDIMRCVSNFQNLGGLKSKPEIKMAKSMYSNNLTLVLN